MTARVVRVPLGPADASLFPDASLMDRARALAAEPASFGLRPARVERAESLDALTGAAKSRVWLVDDSLQNTGSFKARGALVALRAIRDGGVDTVVSASAGNHGAGVAFAARALGMRALVVVPSVAPAAKREKIAALGAEILVHESPSYDVAEAYAMQLAKDRGVTFLSAYDDARIVAGNGVSLAFEATRGIGRVPDAVLVPFGGGGLACGLAWGLAAEAGDRFELTRRVWGAQSEASPSLAMSLERGEAVERFEASIPTVAEGLEGGIARDAFARARSVIAGVVVVDERAIRGAVAFAHRTLGRTLEGSAAAALAVLREGLPAELGAPRDLAVVLTGSNLDAARLEGILAEA